MFKKGVKKQTSNSLQVALTHKKTKWTSAVVSELAPRNGDIYLTLNDPLKYE